MSNYENQYSGATPVVGEYGNPIRSDEHGHRTHTGEYGNPIRSDEHGHRTHTGEYGNPIRQTNTGYGTGGFDTTTHQGMRTNATTPTYGGDYHNDQQQNQGPSAMLHRSGSNSSSSSEDDGMGGRRKKKGMTEKIKEKIPGLGHKDDDSYQQSHATSATTPGYYEGQQHEEKKGIMDKIKEKLPGHH